MSSARRESADRLVRTYVVTSGRGRASRNHFDHITLIRLSDAAAHLSRAYLQPEHRALLGGLAHSAQSVVELGALLNLPVSVVRILLADLMESGHITTQRDIRRTTTVDTSLLEEVLAGLKRL